MGSPYGVSRPVCCVSPEVSHIIVRNLAKHMGWGRGLSKALRQTCPRHIVQLLILLCTLYFLPWLHSYNSVLLDRVGGVSYTWNNGTRSLCVSYFRFGESCNICLCIMTYLLGEAHLLTWNSLTSYKVSARSLELNTDGTVSILNWVSEKSENTISKITVTIGSPGLRVFTDWRVLD